jgi:hypothetical protein
MTSHPFLPLSLPRVPVCLFVHFTCRLQNCMMWASTVSKGELQMVCGRETEEKSVACGFTCCRRRRVWGCVGCVELALSVGFMWSVVNGGVAVRCLALLQARATTYTPHRSLPLITPYTPTPPKTHNTNPPPSTVRHRKKKVNHPTPNNAKQRQTTPNQQ